VLVVTHADDVARRTACRIRLHDGRVVLDPDRAWRAQEI
jgi:ABC-type lipoprotein export system ATPase subunit